MKRDNVYALAAVLLIVVVVSIFASVVNNSLQPKKDGSKKPFYLGVTYCGSSVEEAQALIDRVKNYTSLFVVQSYHLQTHIDELNQVCDYAVNSDLDIIVYFGAYKSQMSSIESFLAPAETRWGSHFLGLYYNDEPGGKMLDLRLELGNVTKYEDGGVKRIDALTSTYDKDFLTGGYEKETYFERLGEISVSTTQSLHQKDGASSYTYTTTNYLLNGTIQYLTQNLMQNMTSSSGTQTVLWYHPDGTVQDENGTYTTDQGNITLFTPYQQLWDTRPFRTYSDAANIYNTGLGEPIGWVRNQSTCKVFTSDYALYWFDYEAGYDTVLAQLGPACNPKQDIALVRGAASMHDKPWGTILTWKNSSNPSSLMSGDEMYENLKVSYESGAEYAIVFNYAPDVNGTGLLQDEHYLAIERFWKEIVQNPEARNDITIEDALVLPADYGWGMRNINDTIWGLWQPDDKAAQIWNNIQNLLSSKDGRLDIIYEDSAAQTNNLYSEVHCWNNTK